ncbi:MULTISPECIES: GNAT family N-acetyltransferase [Symbiopectobacterium]|uniref:GNAT family N-acetyltransferase n=1 Tax=Candidatus Symbiopectobacterium sp. PLON1 TaxID=2794575 RepID=UPI001A31C50D|nr:MULTISPECIES: GNAT family N-acetyltransferase [Symbiopectobacterium]MBG6248148.1 hypothetical protein [Candidatus Symbiopectobacterium sp. PLON1]MBT9430569.1 hypothetical protein [Candidatus Symbiopectobacterium endolongispinus]
MHVISPITSHDLPAAFAIEKASHAWHLLEQLIETLEARGITTLWLEVRASNAIALYEQLRFNEVSLRRNYYPADNGREDAVIMELPL